MTKNLARAIGLAAVMALAGCGGGDAPEATVQAGGKSADRTKSLALASQAGTAAARRPLRGSGEIDVWVTLDQDSLARKRALLAETTGQARKRALSGTGGEGRAEPAAIRSAMAAQRSTILAQQADVGQRLASLGARELARVSVVHNAIAVTIDASQLPALAALPGVRQVRPVVHYELHLGETVPYVGAAAVQAAGVDGTGVKVAVLDSGIDYTHRNLGGAGTAAAYAAAWGTSTADPLNTTRDGLFPTAKVVDGYDFVGEAWPSGARTEDPDPIDLQGHGTHVADIIGGASADGAHKGMAPGASLMAVKVCSAVATSCNGIALLMGMDYAMDPNGDGDLSDAADVINMSLGSSYGQIEDDLTAAAANAVAAGTIVVASAGNSGDKPYVTGSPAMGPGVISVAQTSVPSASVVPLVVNAPAAIAGTYNNTATLDWAPVGAGVTGDVMTALQGGAADNLACVALPAGSLTGKVALIDRGSCAISIKVDNAAKAGATGFLLGLVAAGDAVTFSYGGGTDFVPSLVIQQSLANAIKARLTAGETVNVTISNANAISLAGSMASTSSRGPSYGLHGIKPEIGAPGASVSAEVGTGTGATAFGGTSGAAPMVSGAAALLLQAHPARSPMQIKAMLMNRAETAVDTNPVLYPGQKAPITRIGAGELRVDRSLGATAVAWDADALSASLSFGAVEAAHLVVLERTLTVQDFSGNGRQFRLDHDYRYADDEAARAVRLLMPRSVYVPANGSAKVKVRMLIDPSKLPDWTLDGGANGGNGQRLNLLEVDGFVTLSSRSETLSVPWHVLPRKAALTWATRAWGGRHGKQGQDVLNLVNVGADTGEYDLFSLTGTSAEGGLLPAPAAGDNYALVDLKSVGVRYLADAGALQFAIATHGRRSHPVYPGGFEVDIDTNGDGVPDFYVFQQELGGFAATGSSVVYVQSASTGTASAYYYNDADLNSGNVIYTIPLAALGITPDMAIGFDVYAYDNYFTGVLTDVVGGMRFTPGSPRYSAASEDGPSGAVGRRGSLKVPYARATVDDSGSTESGLLMMYRRNAAPESQEVALD